MVKYTFWMVFNAILGRIQCSVLFFRKFFVRAILYASSNYGCEEYSFERPDIIYKDLYIRTKLLFRRKCCVKKIISKSSGEKMKPDTKIITRLSQSAHSKYQYIYCWCINPKLERSGPKLPLSCQIKVHFCSKCAANLGLPLGTSYVLGKLNFGNILHRAGRGDKNKGSSAALLECLLPEFE